MNVVFKEKGKMKLVYKIMSLSYSSENVLKIKEKVRNELVCPDMGKLRLGGHMWPC